MLTLDPNNREARHNLDLLLQRRGQARPPVPVPQGSTPAVAVAGAQPRVSLCMIVRNEEANLPACLESVAGLVDEIVIVDTGSTDSTRAVAARYGARVFDFPWVDSFAAARNESLRHARGAWILWLDADDRLDPANRERLRALLAGLGDERAAYVMKCLCLPNHQTGVETVVDHVRLFRNLPGLRWRYRIHEQILPDLRRAGCDIRWSGVVVHHTGYQDPATLARKLQRDERLLLMELAEDPDEPFTQFNLGALRQEQGRLEEAAGHFQKSLDRSRQGDTIHRKLFALLAQCHNRLGRPEPALAACAECLRLYSDDAEALVQEGMARRALKDLAGAAACWERVLASPPADYFQSINAGLRGYTTRHNLAVVYEELGVVRHARSHWEAALAERPDYEPAWRGLAGLYLRQQMWSELERLAASLESQPGGAARAAVLRGRALLARQEFAAARRLLEGVVAPHPVDPEPRTVLSHVLLQEGRDWAAAEAALRGLLEIDPEQQEARHNLAVLLRQQGRA